MSASATIPPAAPQPQPVPVPIASLDTAEYRRTNSATTSGAIEAWAAGYSGQSIVVGLVDSGIAADSPEFAGRIHGSSRDVAGSGRSIQDEGGHGTSVAAVLGAARNGGQIVGLAPQATLAVMRADRAGSCATADGCRYSDSTLAAGIEAAAATGARVINISLGGSPGNAALRSAFANATRSAVLVISGGNDSAAQIDALPTSALASGNKAAIIIVGAVDENRQLASFSNRAGSAQDNFITALGVRVRSFDQNGTAFLYSGSSYATPQVSGAIALLAQAYPNLTSAQLVDLLLRSADDAGAPGPDPVYGRGILNIARAFAPSGGTSLAGSAVPVSLSANGSLGSAFGDGASFGAALGSVPIIDGYGRTYGLKIGSTLRTAGPARLGAALGSASLERADTRWGGFSLALRAMKVSQQTHHADSFRRGDSGDAPLGFAQRGLDAHAASRNPLRESRFGYQSGAVRVEVASGHFASAALPASGPSGLVAPDGLEADSDPARDSRALVLLETRLAGGRIALSGSHGELRLTEVAGLARRARQSRVSAGLSAPVGPLLLGARATHVADEGSLLGTRLSPALGLMGGKSLLLGGSLDSTPVPHIALRVAASMGYHQPRLANTGLLRPGETLRSIGWSLAASAPGLRTTDRLTLRLAQPLALTAGSFAAADGKLLPAAPAQRERAAELSYDRDGVGFTVFHRSNPGHQARPADAGAAITLSRDF